MRTLLDAPPLLQTLMASIAIVLSPPGTVPRDLSWKACGKLLAHPEMLIRRLQAVVCSLPGPDEAMLYRMHQLWPYVNNNDFRPFRLEKIGGAAASMLCACVLAIVEYTDLILLHRALGAYTADGQPQQHKAKMLKTVRALNCV
jgi:hypothetical protein